MLTLRGRRRARAGAAAAARALADAALHAGAVRRLPPVRGRRRPTSRSSPARATSSRCRWWATRPRRAALRALCLRVLRGRHAARARWPRSAGSRWSAHGWTAWLPAGRGGAGLAVARPTLWATRAQALSRAGRRARRAVRRRVAAAGRRGAAGRRRAGPDRRADRRRRRGRRRLLRLPLAATRLRPAPRAAGAQLARRFRDFPLLNTPHAFMGALQDTRRDRAARRLAGPGRGRLLGPVAALPEGAGHAGGRRGVAGALSAAGGARRVGRPRRRRARAPARHARGPRRRAPRDGGPRRARRAAGAAAVGVRAVGCSSALFGAAVARRRRAGARAGACTSACTSSPRRWPSSRSPGARRPGRCGWRWSGQVAFVAALAVGPAARRTGRRAAGRVSIAMTLYFGYYFVRLATWPLTDGGTRMTLRTT